MSGITLIAPAGAMCGLYLGMPSSVKYFEAIDQANALSPTSVKESDGKCEYYYSDLNIGLYHYGVSMDGYTAICQIINYTEEKDDTGVVINVELDRLAGCGYEQGFVMLNTEEFIGAQLASKKDSFGKEYERLFNTPQFTRREGRVGRHRHTTNEELYEYIEGIAEGCDNMYLFSLGKTPKYNFDMPLVLFTKENVGSKTLEEAAEIIKADGKPTVQYAAQVHSNEPASSEGALAMISELASDYGRSVLDSVDVYIVPRINLDGAPECIRQSPTTLEDMNRDYLRMNNREVCMLTCAYNMFLPELVVDGHEKRTDFLKSGESSCTDMELQVGAGALNHPAEMTEMAMDVALQAIKNAKEIGLRAHFYQRFASAAGGSAGSSYYGTRNSLSFLVETPGGVSSGMNFIGRRVMAQYILASTVINYAVEHADKVMDTVRRSREKMALAGHIYDESRVVVLEHGKTQTGSLLSTVINVPDGKVIDEKREIPYDEHTQALRSRTRPTAYIIPRGTENEQEILRVLTVHAVPYYETPKKSVIKARQYLKNDAGIELLEELAVRFENGAYVFPNTVPSTILSVVMEPDFNASSGRKMTLFSMGLITPDKSGQLPIYRYCHGLTDGKVELVRN